MSPERWREIKDSARKNFELEDEGSEDLVVETADGPVKQGEAEFVIFVSPLGRTKLELQKKPKLEEKKYHYSKREGDSARVEYKFSENEVVYTFRAYKWGEAADDWQEISPEGFG